MFYIDYMFSREHSTIVYLCGLVLLFTPVGWERGWRHSAFLPVEGGVRPCGGFLIMFRPLGCSVSNVPHLR